VTKKWDVVVVGGANWDYLTKGPALPEPGQTVRGDEFQEAPGGKGANQAVAAARLGAKVAMVGRVGDDDRGRRIVDRFREEGVDVMHVMFDPSATTGVALVHVGGDGEKQIQTAPGANERLTIADVAAARAYLEDTKVLLLQLEPPLDVVIAAAQLAHAAGARVVLDPAPPSPQPLGDDLLRLVHLIRPNADEARALTGLDVQDQESAREAASRLVDRGVTAAVVQGGSEGDLAVWRDDNEQRELWLPRIPVEAVDATGAGDSFVASLAVMIARKQSMKRAGVFASAAAALTTTKVGAQAALPTFDEVEALLASAQP
jgi:ribokinase